MVWQQQCYAYHWVSLECSRVIMIKNISILLLTASLLTGCFPSNPKSEDEVAIDNQKKESLVGTWVLNKVDGKRVGPDQQTKISFSKNGISKSWLGHSEREGKWVFTDSARVIALQDGNVGERLKIRSLTETEFIYTITVKKREVELSYLREK